MNTQILHSHAPVDSFRDYLVAMAIRSANGWNKIPYEHLKGYHLLAGRQGVSGFGLFVVEGDFDREAMSRAVADARKADVCTADMLVYADSLSYRGRGIEFVSFKDIGATRSSYGAMASSRG